MGASARLKRLAPLAGATLAGALALLAAACGGGSALEDIEVAPGRVSCEALVVADGYRFSGEVVLDLKDRDESVEPEGGDTYNAEGFTVTQTIEGSAQGRDKVSIVTDSDVDETAQPTGYVRIGETIWVETRNGWVAQSINQVHLPYLPLDTCNSIAPDIRLDGMDSTAETVNGAETQKYHFDALQSDFPDRHPSFGRVSDVALYINDFEGDIWVAEVGGYIARLDLSGAGSYENGRGLEVLISYELSDMDDSSIDIKEPG